MTDTCKRPPEGWWCNLPAGHEGPCPTRSVFEDAGHLWETPAPVPSNSTLREQVVKVLEHESAHDRERLSDVLMPLFASVIAEAEQRGATKQQESDALAADEYVRNVINDPKYGHVLDWVKLNARGVDRIIRAVPYTPTAETEK